MTADAAVKWALSGKFAQNRAVNYLTDVIQPVLTIDGVRQPIGKYIPTDAYTEHDGMRPVVSLTAYDLTYLAMSSKIETRLHLAKGTLYTAAIQALLVESGITDFFVEANTATLQADPQDWEQAQTVSRSSTPWRRRSTITASGWTAAARYTAVRSACHPRMSSSATCRDGSIPSNIPNR